MYINFDLTEESSAGVNVQLLLRAGDKKQYWLSKVLCITISTSLYFVLGVIVTLGCGFALGGVSSLEIDKLILNVMNLSSMIPREATSPAFIPTLLMVWFAILTITLLQQLISLFIEPIGSFLVVAVFLFLSAYFMKPFFFGNYAMIGSQANSSGSYWTPRAKIIRYLDQSEKISRVSVASLKLRIMMQICRDNDHADRRKEGEEWVYEDMKAHQEHMLRILKVSK